MVLGRRVDHIAVAVDRKQAVEAGSIGSAVRTAAAPEPVVLALDIETAGTTTENMGSVAAGQVAAAEVCYTPTVLEDMAMMFRKSSG
jgi:hypothetical protein